jgi:hypothetical protein
MFYGGEMVQSASRGNDPGKLACGKSFDGTQGLAGNPW